MSGFAPRPASLFSFFFALLVIASEVALVAGAQGQP